MTLKEAALWTDGRYFLQAEKQLDTNWQLMRGGLKTTPSKEEWLGRVLPAGSKVGVDARLVAFEAARKMAEALKKHGGNSLELLGDNLVDAVWGERPAVAHQPIFALASEYAGRTSADKVAALQKHLAEQGHAGFLVSALDEVAWLFNLRGSDIPFNPLFFSYALVQPDAVTLYLTQDKLAREKAELAGVRVQPYEAVFADIAGLQAKLAGPQKLLISPSCNAALAMAAGGEAAVVIKPSPVEAEKALKNDVEMAGFRQCHIRDAAALVRPGRGRPANRRCVVLVLLLARAGARPRRRARRGRRGRPAGGAAARPAAVHGAEL